MFNWFCNAYNSVEAWLAARGFSLEIYANSLHFYGSFMLMILFAGILGINVFISAGIVLLIGIVKELIDWQIRGTEFSWMDIAFDAAGILAGLVFCWGVKL